MTLSSKLHVLKKLWHPEVSLEDINQRDIRERRQIIVRKVEHNMQDVLFLKKNARLP